MRMIDANSLKRAINKDKALRQYLDCGHAKSWLMQTIDEQPTIQPEQRTDTLKAEIKRMKRAFTTCINSDYYTGYMSALSAVEGYIAQLEGANKDAD